MFAALFCFAAPIRGASAHHVSVRSALGLFPVFARRGVRGPSMSCAHSWQCARCRAPACTFATSRSLPLRRLPQRSIPLLRVLLCNAPCLQSSDASASTRVTANFAIPCARYGSSSTCAKMCAYSGPNLLHAFPLPRRRHVRASYLVAGASDARPFRRGAR
eukprot:4474051-Pleurochrysis_carterae.AAC.1